MSSFVYALGIFILFFVLVYGHYATFAWTVCKYTKKMKRVKRDGKVKMVFPPLTTSERILSCIPFYQCAVVRKALYGSATVTSILSILSLVLILANIVVSLFFPFNGYVVFFLHIGFYIGVIIGFLLYGIVTFDCARMYDCGMLVSILAFIFPHVFCFNIRNAIPHYMGKLAKEGVFKSKYGDTSTKQKADK